MKATENYGADQSVNQYATSDRLVGSHAGTAMCACVRMCNVSL